MSFDPDRCDDSQAIDSLLCYASDALRDHVVRLSVDRRMGIKISQHVIDVFQSWISRAYDLRHERTITIARKDPPASIRKRKR